MRDQLQLRVTMSNRCCWIWYRLCSYNGEGNGTPLQHSCLESPMDGGAWLAAVHGVAKSRTRLNNFTFTFYFHALEKEMATHSSVLACRIPGTGEPGGLPSMGSHRVGHDWSDLAATAAAEYIMRNAGLEETQAAIKIAGRNINNLRYADDTTLMAEKRNSKASWWKWKWRVKKLA